MRDGAVWWFGVLAVASFSFSGCGTPAAKLSAVKSGDLSHVLADRRRPDAELVASCGDGELTQTGARDLRRRPYLQQVSESRALLAFTSAGSKHVVVDVTTPSGTPVTSVLAVPDATARPAGAWQGIAEIDGLSAGEIYCYELRGMSGRAGFRTAPAARSAEPVRFIAFGDSGTGNYPQYEVMKQMFTVPFDLAIHTGDVAYDIGTLRQLERGFFQVYADLTKSFSFSPTSGNHDYSTDAAAPFREVFVLPENGGPNGIERWYSFDWGHVHFVALDTELMGSEQASWLDEDLASTTKPWTIVYAHRPPYSSGKHGSSITFRRIFQPILEKHRVPLVLSGHEHHYERIKPQGGVIYIVTGGGGRGTRAVSASDFTAFSEDVLHFVQVEVHANELFLHAIDGTGREFDSLRIAQISH
jgi:hypothetical protein